MPSFSGSHGPELARSLREIEHTFEKHLSGLKAIQKTILDVKASSWHDDYNKFKAGVKDLEVMVQNVINSGFGTITTIQEGVELLEVFAHLTTREVCMYMHVHVCVLHNGLPLIRPPLGSVRMS